MTITIPPAALEAAVSAYNYASSDCYTTQEQDMGTAIAAALAAWPGMECRPTFEPSRIILHLTENSDE